MKSILILSATAGAGHLSAGEALAETARELSLPVRISHEDILNFTSPLFKKLYSDTYNTLANKSPELWGYLYKKTGRISDQKALFLKLFDQFNYKKYLRMLEETKPDAVLCTHFLPYAAIADEIRKPSWQIPFFTVPTDYDVHSIWINRDVKHYYAATEEAAWTIRAHGVTGRNISVTGIPVMPGFQKKAGQRRSRIEMKFPPHNFTVMLLSGGYGIGVMDQVVTSVATFLSQFRKQKFQMLVVCGKNRGLYQRLKSISYPKNVGTEVYQYVSFVDKLMDCSDLLVTKSGGLTVSEALAKELPMIIFDPIPGQETRNADYLVEQGTALRAASLANLHFKLKTLIEHKSLLSRMKAAARRISRPGAAKSILEDVLRRIGA